MSGAAELAGEVAQSSPREIELPREALTAKDNASIFFVSLPKSGTVFTWQCLHEVSGLRIPDFQLMDGWHEYSAGSDFACPELYACGDYNTQLLRPENMGRFAQGYIFGGHMQASYHNMRVLKGAGIDRISVLLRDPRDAFVSWVHHLRKLGPSARNYHSRIYHIPRDYYDWSLQRQFEYQIRTFLPVTVNWVEGWLDYYASADRDVDVLFVYYDELKRDPARYVRRLSEFHGIGPVDTSRIPSAEPGKLHFRKGEHEQWREEFSERDQRLVDELMGDRIVRAFDSAARAHRGQSQACAELGRGRPARAASAALRALREFPNSPAAQSILLAAEAEAGDTHRVRDLLHAQGYDRSVAGQFIYRYDFVDACAALVAELESAAAAREALSQQS